MDLYKYSIVPPETVGIASLAEIARAGWSSVRYGIEMLHQLLCRLRTKQRVRRA